MKRIYCFVVLVFLVNVAWAENDYKINIPYAQAIDGLADILLMRVLPSIPDEEPRFIGQSEDSLLILRLEGHTDDVWNAVLIINTIYVGEPIAERNGAIAVRLLQNFQTGLGVEGFNEMMELITQPDNHYTPLEIVTEDNKQIEFLFIPSAQLITITIIIPKAS